MGAHVPHDVMLKPKPKKRSTMEVHVPHDVILKPKLKRSKMEVHVPHDVILNHILPRVPAKTVGRLRCVSKEWHSLLTSDMFTNMHIDNHKNNPKLLVLSKTETSFEFTIIDCEAPPSDKGLTTTRRPLPSFEGITPGGICILASFHGLVCLGISTYGSSNLLISDLIFWNPLTKEYKRLSKSNECNKFWYSSSDFGLYYSCCEDDYKLLYVDVPDRSVYIYSLKSDSWRKVDVPLHRNGTILDPERWNRGIYLNENLYFLQVHLNRRSSSVIRFDTKSEMFSRIETPSVDNYQDTHNCNVAIMDKSDCIHVCVKYNIKNSCDTYIKLWKLDEYRNMKEEVFYQLRRPHGYNHILKSYLIPFHLMKNGNWLMRDWWSNCKHKIYKVDLKKKTQGNIYDEFEYVEVRVDDDNNNNNYIIDEEVRYIETFVSPNRYMK